VDKLGNLLGRVIQRQPGSGQLTEYRLRIAEVIRDYGLNERDEAPADSRAAHG